MDESQGAAKELVRDFRGRTFGELVLFHAKRQSSPQIMEALAETILLLPKGLQGEIEQWIDMNVSDGQWERFWRSDCGEVCLSILERARDHSLRNGAKPDDATLINLFQIVVLNFAYGARQHPSSKAFIQRAIGMGFLRRLFG
ncbi:MAG: hypothetical protein AB7E84_05425 [Xanthobacteraceae bacterium]